MQNDAKQELCERLMSLSFPEYQGALQKNILKKRSLKEAQIVWFTRQHCPYCENMKNDWRRARQKNKKVKWIVVDVEKNKDWLHL